MQRGRAHLGLGHSWGQQRHSCSTRDSMAISMWHHVADGAAEQRGSLWCSGQAVRGEDASGTAAGCPGAESTSDSICMGVRDDNGVQVSYSAQHIKGQKKKKSGISDAPEHECHSEGHVVEVGTPPPAHSRPLQPNSICSQPMVVSRERTAPVLGEPLQCAVVEEPAGPDTEMEGMCVQV